MRPVLSSLSALRLLRLVQVLLVLVGVWTMVTLELARRDLMGPNELMVPVNMAKTAEAHLYYDVGRGFWHGDVSIRRVTGQPDEQVIAFELPRLPVRGLRFDPTLQPGEFEIGAPWLQTRTGRVVAKFPLTAVVPWHQVAAWERSPMGWRAVTTPDATDAQVVLELGAPLRTGSPRWPWVEGALIMVLAGVGFVLGRHPANRDRPGIFARGRRGMAAAPELLVAAWYDNRPRLAILGAAVVGVAQLWALRGSADTIDLPMWDESNYAARGAVWAREGGPIGDLHTAPVYVAMYALLAPWGGPEQTVGLLAGGLRVLTAVGLYLVLLRCWRRWPAAMAAALVWVSASFQLTYPLLVYHGAWLWFLAALVTIDRWPTVGLLLLTGAIGARQDYQFILPLAVAVCGWRWWREGCRWTSWWVRIDPDAGRPAAAKGERGAAALLAIGLALGLLVVASDTLSIGGSVHRGWFAFQQHYALRAVVTGEVHLVNPLAEYPRVMAADFPGATSLWEAAQMNPSAVVRHLSWNLRHAPGEWLALWRPPAGLWPGWLACLLAAGVALAGEGAAGRAHVRPGGWRARAGLWTLGLGGLIAVGPGLVVLAKGSYLLASVPLVAGLAGLGIRALGRRLPPLGRGQAAAAGLGTLAVAVVALGASPRVFEPPAVLPPVRALLEDVRSIWPEQGRHTLVGYGAGSLANYLGAERCVGVEPVKAVTGDTSPDASLPELLERHRPYAVLVGEDWLRASGIDETPLRQGVVAGDWHVRERDGTRLYWRTSPEASEAQR